MLGFASVKPAAAYQPSEVAANRPSTVGLWADFADGCANFSQRREGEEVDGGIVVGWQGLGFICIESEKRFFVTKELILLVVRNIFKVISFFFAQTERKFLQTFKN